jgi:periplasmic divalent cation tolerance protein
MSDVLIVYCTLPDDERADQIVRALVDERLVACVNLLPGVRSFYRWEGKVCDDPERLAIIKTTVARFEAMKARLLELHPYDVPEVIAVPVDRGADAYLAWVRSET